MASNGTEARCRTSGTATTAPDEVLLPAPLKELDTSLQVKLGRLATSIGVKAIRELGYESKTAFIKEKTDWLLNPT